MSVLSGDFVNSFKSVEPGGFEPLPEGDYTVRADSAEVRQAKSGRGQYIHVQFDVLGPKCQGRKLFARFNIVNDNPEAARIGQQQLKNFLLASGMSQDQINQFNDTDQLIGLTCNVRVEIEPGREDYGPQNRIRSFRRAENPKPAGSGGGDNLSGAFAPSDGKPWFA